MKFKSTPWYQRAYAAFKATPVLHRVLVALAIVAIVSVSCDALT